MLIHLTGHPGLWRTRTLIVHSCQLMANSLIRAFATSRSRSRPAARRLPPALCVLTLLLLSATAQADDLWSGYWATTWRDGGARLHLEQQGDHVTGSYPLYGGRVEAKAEGRQLDGQWFEGDRHGSFVFVMGRDNNSFAGRYDTGEWWTGARSNAPDKSLAFDASSPREAFRQFIINCNLARAGRQDAWGSALLAVDFGGDAATMPLAEQIERVRNLFDVIDLTTFRIWSLPTEASGDTVPVRLEQSGSDATLTLTLQRDAKGKWHIRMPTPRELDAARHTLLAARGGQPPTADAFRRLQNPRDTMRSFLEGMSTWNTGGRSLALSTLDLSGIPEVLRNGQGALDAQFLRRILNQIGLIGLQSIPNDSADRTPYLHFSHPAGRVVIAPSGPEPNAPWQFTAETVDNADHLYLAIDNLPPPLATPPGLIPDAPYFNVRDRIRANAPALLGRAGPAEYWQLIFALLVLSTAAGIGTLGARLIRRGITRITGGVSNPPRLFTVALGITLGAAFANRFPTIIGAPEEIRRVTYPIIGMIVTLTASIAAWHLLEVVGVLLQKLSDRTASATDDILFTLLLAAARLAVVIAAFLGVAYFLSIPTSGILAGLGIGGLAFAFASRETLSNVFGAGILVADRPFRRGDWITAGDIDGSVEHVGIRSTRLRTTQDSIMVVPNGRLADSTINNLGTRRHRLLKTQLLVTAGATPEKLDAFTAAVRQRIIEDPAFLAHRTDVVVSNIVLEGVQIDVTTYMDASTASAERAARHALLVDIMQVAEANGLSLGQGMHTGDEPAEPSHTPRLAG